MTETQSSKAERVERTEKLAFTIADAAEVLSVSERTVYRLIKTRKLYPTRSLRRISREELLRYLREETALTFRSRNFQTKHQLAAR